MTKSNNIGKLTDADIRRVSLRYMFGGQLGWNYERMVSVAYARAIYPALVKLYGKDSEELKEAMKMELQFFNTSPFLTSVIIGIDLSLQNEKGIEAKEAVAAIKTGLMGPFAAVGDALFGALLPTIFGSIAAYMGLEGNPLGVILWLLFSIPVLIFRYVQVPFGFKEGKKLVSSVGNVLNNLTDSATLLGVVVIGALIPTVVRVIAPYQFIIGKLEDGTDKILKLQDDILDKIAPSIVPIALTVLAYWLLGRKHMNSTRVIWIFLIGSIALSSLKILGV